MLSIFVAAAFSEAARVRAPHAAMGPHARILSTWAEDAAASPGPEDLDSLDDEQALDAWEANRNGVFAADVFIMLADTTGREAHAECEWRRAHRARKPAIWIGPPTLTVRNRAHVWPGLMVMSEAEAVAHIRAMAREGRAA